MNAFFISIPAGALQSWSNTSHIMNSPSKIPTANRVSDFLEIAELMCIDALGRTESCGGHFRLESQTPEGEAKRDDANFSYTAAWEWKGSGQAPRFIRNRSHSSMFLCPKGVTSSHESHTQNLAAAKRRRTGQVR
jgi:hypothetical protein